jgi:tRNA modification GTPase
VRGVEVGRWRNEDIELLSLFGSYAGEVRVALPAERYVYDLRHRKALETAVQSFSDAARSLRENVPMEVVVVDLKSGIDALGEIVGETATEEVLESIFSQFCLGK